MEKKFEEKFGLKTEEMEEILGGLTSPSATIVVGPACSFCKTCIMCTSCTYCSTCVMCQSFAFVAGQTLPETGSNLEGFTVHSETATAYSQVQYSKEV
jgi:hypothetical protein